VSRSAKKPFFQKESFTKELLYLIYYKKARGIVKVISTQKVRAGVKNRRVVRGAIHPSGVVGNSVTSSNICIGGWGVSPPMSQ